MKRSHRQWPGLDVSLGIEGTCADANGVAAVQDEPGSQAEVSQVLDTDRLIRRDPEPRWSLTRVLTWIG